jgi:hypothetical protein
MGVPVRAPLQRAAAIKGVTRHVVVEEVKGASLQQPLRSPMRPTAPPPLSERERREAENSALRRLPLRSPLTSPASPQGTPLALLKMPLLECAQPQPLQDHGLDDGDESYNIPR